MVNPRIIAVLAAALCAVAFATSADVGGGGSGGVTGPGTTVANNCVKWGNATGTVLADAGAGCGGGGSSSGAAVHNTVSESIAHSGTGANQLVTFNTVDIDQGPPYFAANSFTANAVGWYTITFTGNFDANGTGIRKLVFSKNGADLYGWIIDGNGSAGWTTNLVFTAVARLALNDVITINASQNSGGALNLNAPTASFVKLP